jgi:hypothetical protein
MTAQRDDRHTLGVTITNREIYDQVLATKDLTAKLVDKVDAIEKRDGDHETRIRSLERWRWTVVGIAAAISAAGGGVVSALTKG